MQVNNHQPHFPGDTGAAYIENKKTGSLYGIRNAYKALARDNEWFTLKLRVQGPRVRIHVNDTLVVDYLEPEGDVAGLTPPLQKIGKGTFALQCHDAQEPGAVSAHRRASAAAGGGGQTTRAPNPDPASAKRYRLARDNFPLVDLRALDVKDVRPARGGAGRGPRRRRCSSASRASRRPGPAPIRDDASVDALVRRFAGKPLFLGLRADDRGWATAITPKALAKVDFVLLDGETLAAARAAGRVGRSAGLRRRAASRRRWRRSRRSRSTSTARRSSCRAALAAQRDAIWTEARQQQVHRRRGREPGRDRDQRRAAAARRGVRAQGQGRGREVHARRLRGATRRPATTASASARRSASRGATCTSPATSRPAAPGRHDDSE